MHTYKTKEFVIPVPAAEKMAEVHRAFGEAGVNVHGIVVVGQGPQLAMRVVPVDAPKAEEVLRSKGWQFQPGEVLCVRAPNTPGALAAITEKLVKGGVKVEAIYGYATVPEGELVVKPADLGRAAELLKN